MGWTNEVNLNISPSSLNCVEDAEVAVHNIAPKISDISLGSDKCTDVALDGAELINDVAPLQASFDLIQSQPNEVHVEDVGTTAQDEGLQLAINKSVSPSLLSIDIVPASPSKDNGIFDKVDLSEVLPSAVSDMKEEGGKKVAEEETTSP